MSALVLKHEPFSYKAKMPWFPVCSWVFTICNISPYKVCELVCVYYQSCHLMLGHVCAVWMRPNTATLLAGCLCYTSWLINIITVPLVHGLSISSLVFPTSRSHIHLFLKWTLVYFYKLFIHPYIHQGSHNFDMMFLPLISFLIVFS